MGVTNDCGGHTWFTSGSGGPTKALNMLMADHTLLSAPLPVGIVGSVTMAMAFFKSAKACGQRGFVSLESVYTYLGLTSGGGTSSKWMNECLQTLSHVIGQLFPGDHLLASCHDGKGEAHSATPFHKQMLPWQSMSVLGLVVLLSRWSFLGTTQGGLHDGATTQKAYNLLFGICNSLPSCTFNLQACPHAYVLFYWFGHIIAFVLFAHFHMYHLLTHVTHVTCCCLVVLPALLAYSIAYPLTVLTCLTVSLSFSCVIMLLIWF